jgi:hypothetical protein
MSSWAWDFISSIPASVGQTVESYYNAATGEKNTNTFGAGSYVSASAVEHGAGNVPGAAAVQSAGNVVAATAGKTASTIYGIATSKILTVAATLAVVAGAAVYFGWIGGKK